MCASKNESVIYMYPKILGVALVPHLSTRGRDRDGFYRQIERQDPRATDKKARWLTNANGGEMVTLRYKQVKTINITVITV